MKKILELLVKPSRLILLIASIVYVSLYAISGFGSLGGEFMPLISRLIIMLVTIAAVVSIPVLLILKKDNIAKIVFALVGGFWLVDAARSYVSDGQAVINGADGLYITAGIFGFLAGLCLTAVLILLVFSFVLKKEALRFVSILVFIIGYVFIFITSIFQMIIEGQVNAGWTLYFISINMMVAPIAVLFGYLYFFSVPDYDLNKTKQTEE